MDGRVGGAVVRNARRWDEGSSRKPYETDIGPDHASGPKLILRCENGGR